MKVYLVDGTFELFRCFHGSDRRQDTEGNEIGAARAFLYTMVSLLRDDQVTHVAVAFDTILPPRDAKKRRDAESLIGLQAPVAADIVRALGLALWPMVRYSADDALATGARLFKDAPGVDQVILCSSDNDFTQCVEGERVVLLNRIQKRTTDEAGVVERFGVTPALIPSLFALVGDVSDRIPGLPGFGLKSAGALLRRWGSLEAIPTDPCAWDCKVRSATRLAKVLAERRNEALLYRNLSRLRDDVPLVDTLDDLRWRGARRPELEALAERLQVTEALEKVRLWRAKESEAGLPPA